MAEFHGSHDGIATLATKRVADTTQFGVAIIDGDGRIQGFQEKPPAAEALSDLANCGIYMFRSAIFDYFPEPGTSGAASTGDPPGFADWAMDVFPALLEGDVPFYSHEIDRYWNDIGNLDELRQGNIDALLGAVAVDPGAASVGEGIWSATELEAEQVAGPALVGAEVELGDGARVEGPVVVGDGCRIGAGALVRDAILLEGSEVPAKGMVVGGITARIAPA
jgi:mannose-1-phosphate guanylyltransferase/mannose-1-phosphate guanylyltransferase/phosphomannomutase